MTEVTPASGVLVGLLLGLGCRTDPPSAADFVPSSTSEEPSRTSSGSGSTSSSSAQMTSSGQLDGSGDSNGDPICGNGVVEGPETCDDAGESRACDLDCTIAECGDGVLNELAGEACDDGGASDRCDADCTPAICGDGTINAAAGEACDDGGESSMCDNDCTPTTCGDGVVNATAGEACDGGGRTAACNEDCTLAGCGDGVVNVAAGEECDDAGESASCDLDCTVALCGDGQANATAGEACDDAGESLACNDDCSPSACGDGITNEAAGEDCDDGVESATCDTDCTSALCGDGLLNLTAAEACEANDLAGATCESLGFITGTLACNAACSYETSTCYYDSCLHILDAEPGAVSGAHTIDADGNGPLPPFETYCDMDTDGGGWTYLATITTNGEQINEGNWLQSSPSPNNWENSNQFGLADPNANADAKSPAFYAVSGSAIQIQHNSSMLLYTTSGCVPNTNLADYLSSLDWTCAGSQSFAMHPACTHHCIIANSSPSPGDESLLGGQPRDALYLKAGEAIGAQDVNRDRTYVSTSFRVNVDTPVGLGSHCSGANCASPGEADVTLTNDSIILADGANYYSIWIR